MTCDLTWGLFGDRLRVTAAASRSVTLFCLMARRVGTVMSAHRSLSVSLLHIPREAEPPKQLPPYLNRNLNPTTATAFAFDVAPTLTH